MARPRGHKALQALQSERRSREAEIRRRIDASLSAVRVPPKKKRGELGLVCDCGEGVEHRTPGKAGVVYRLRCPFCERLDFVRFESRGKVALLSRDYAGTSEPGYSITRTPAKALARSLGQIPPFSEIHPGIGKSLQTKVDSLDALSKYLKSHCRDATAHGERKALWDQVRHLESVLRNAWVDFCELHQFRPPDLSISKHRSQLKMLAAKRFSRQAWSDGAHGKFKRHQHERYALRLAIADNRGHVAPLVPTPRYLVERARACVRAKNKKNLSPIYEYARYLRQENCRTWPTIKELVLAFAERDEVLRERIRRIPARNRRLCSVGRPVRYSPFVVANLLRQRLKNPQPSDSAHVRNGYEHILQLLTN